MNMWDKLAALRRPWRSLVKITIFAAVLVEVLFPHPVLLWREVWTLQNPEPLIQTNFAAMPEINRAIDALLATNTTALTEFKAVERFVYQRIKYQYDWVNWGNFDYWPTAEVVWERQREDCDGRAVLAVSILRARGHTEARIVANINHVWVAVGDTELMGPQADKNFRRVGNKTVITVPGVKTLEDWIKQLSVFPALRALVISFTAIVLLYHPCRHVTGFFVVSTIGLCGYVLLFEWSKLRMNREITGLDSNFFLGLLLILTATVLAKAMPEVLARLAAGKSPPPNKPPD